MLRSRLFADLVIVVVLSTGFAATLAVGTSGRFGDQIARQAIDEARWFDADSSRVVLNMTDRKSNNYRVKVHPLFPALTYPVSVVLDRAFGLPGLDRVRVYNIAVGWLWLAAIYGVLRLLGNRRLDSLIFALLAAVASSTIFWFVVPETYQLGSLSILTSVLLAGVASRLAVGDAWFWAASAFSLSVTVTNWMAGLLATAFFRAGRRAMVISAVALFTVSMLSIAQKAVFPLASGNVISPRGYDGEAPYMLARDPGVWMRVARVFFFHSMVMPEIGGSGQRREVSLSVQGSALGSSGALGGLATGRWAALLVAGVVGAIAAAGDRRLRLVLGLLVLGQLALHLLYGPETFLYALNFAPPLVLVSAYGTQTRWRWPVLAVAGR